MKELFISYELALELKNKGFDEYCIFEYDRNGGLCDFRIRKYGFKNSEPRVATAAPLYQQAIDWIESKGWVVNIYSASNEGVDWYFIMKKQLIETGDKYKSREEATIAAIEEALKHI